MEEEEEEEVEDKEGQIMFSGLDLAFLTSTLSRSHQPLGDDS